MLKAMSRRSAWGLGGAAGVVLLGLLAYGILHSKSPAADSSADAIAVETRKEPAPELLREAVPEPASGLAAAGPIAQDPAWRACFDLAEKDFYACIAEAGDFRLSGAEVAALYNQYGQGTTDPRCDFLMRRALLLTAPAQAMEFMDEFFATDQQNIRMQYRIEASMGSLMRSDSGWIEQVAASITPQDLFALGSTEGPVMAAAVLAREHSSLATLLQEGARGEWGGTPDQASRAIHGCCAILSQDAQSVIDFLASVVHSSTLSDDEQVGGSVVAMLSFPQHVVPGSESINCDLILLMLRDPRYRRQAARQLHAMYELNPPRGVPAELWAPVRAEIRAALGK